MPALLVKKLSLLARGFIEEEEEAEAPPYVEPEEEPDTPPVGEPEPPADTPTDPDTSEPEPGIDPNFVEATRVEVTGEKQTVIRTEAEPGTWGNAYVATGLAGYDYWEIHIAQSTPRNATLAVGATNGTLPLNGIPGNLPGTVAYWSDGKVRQNGNDTTGFATFGRGDKIGIARDQYTGRVWFRKNGTWLGSTPTADGSGHQGTVFANPTYYPFIALYSGSTQASFKFITSKFAHAVPSGFYALGKSPNTVGFSFVERSPYNHAQQGVGFDGTYFYATGGVGQDPAEQWILAKYDAAGSLVTSQNTGADGPAEHTQITGVYPDRAGKLYVCANNFVSAQGSNQLDPKGWVFEYGDDLTFITAHALGAKITEQIWPWNGSWWVVNWSAHEIRQLDSSFALVAAHALPDSGPGIPHWQSIFVIDDVFYLNLHEDNADASPLRAYRWNGSGFDAVATSVTRPTPYCTQGAYYHGDYVWWAERLILQERAAIVKSTAFRVAGEPVDTATDGNELREDGSIELREDGANELREVAI